jgi:hypothetical protein
VTATVLALIGLALAALPAGLGAVNLALYRRLPPIDAEPAPPVSVLIPARNEALRIEPALRSVLTSRNATFEILVLDDHSEDDTAAVVTRIASEDERVRLLRSAPLAAGWSGKQYACAQLAHASRHDRLLFMDADVRLAPDALGRMVHRLDSGEAAMISGFPREQTGSFVEHLLIPMIHFLLLGFLPIMMMRRRGGPGFGAACGQLIMVRRDAYEQAGGHAAVRSSRHDGLTLPRAFRRHGRMTDLFDATDLASCRMYDGASETMNGFMKNATEGMATAAALPIWTLLLFGGQVMPACLLIYGMLNGMNALAWGAAASATLLGYALRGLLAVRFRQSWLGVLLHPIGILAVLVIQWRALGRSLLGKATAWRGRV